MLQLWVNSLWSKAVKWQLDRRCKRSKGIPVPCLWVSPKHCSPSTDTVYCTFFIMHRLLSVWGKSWWFGDPLYKRDSFSEDLQNYNKKFSLSICSKWCLGDLMLQGNEAEPRSWSGAWASPCCFLLPSSWLRWEWKDPQEQHPTMWRLREECENWASKWDFFPLVFLQPLIC